MTAYLFSRHDTSENMTFGALSIRERPFHSAKPNTAGVPTSYGRMLGQNRCTTF